MLLKELEVRDTEREIYFDEILWKPLAIVLIKLIRKGKGRNYGLRVFSICHDLIYPYSSLNRIANPIGYCFHEVE